LLERRVQVVPEVVDVFAADAEAQEAGGYVFGPAPEWKLDASTMGVLSGPSGCVAQAAGADDRCFRVQAGGRCRLIGCH
jgi:hypothetical protein